MEKAGCVGRVQLTSAPLQCTTRSPAAPPLPATAAITLAQTWMARSRGSTRCTPWRASSSQRCCPTARCGRGVDLLWAVGGRIGPGAHAMQVLCTAHIAGGLPAAAGPCLHASCDSCVAFEPLPAGLPAPAGVCRHGGAHSAGGRCAHHARAHAGVCLGGRGALAGAGWRQGLPACLSVCLLACSISFFGCPLPSSVQLAPL